MKYYYLIYQITNKLNGMIYIGKHKTTDKNDSYMGSGLRIQRAIKKYGINNFTKTILLECKDEQEMNQKEAEIVNKDFISREDVYNIQIGGGGGDNYSMLSEDEKSKRQQKCRDAFFKLSSTEQQKSLDRLHDGFLKWASTCDRSGCNNPMFGKKLSEEKCNFLSKINTGKNNPNYGKHWYINYKTKQMISLRDGDIIPEGFVKGHTNNFEKKLKKIEKQKQKQNLQQQQYEKRKTVVMEMFKLYNNYGFDEVQKKFYGEPGTSSQSALVHLFERWIEDFKPQRGVKRKIKTNH